MLIEEYLQEFESNLGSRIDRDNVRIYCMQFRSTLVLGENVQLKGTPLVRVKSLSYSKRTLGYMLLMLIIDTHTFTCIVVQHWPIPRVTKLATSIDLCHTKGITKVRLFLSFLLLRDWNM